MDFDWAIYLHIMGFLDKNSVIKFGQVSRAARIAYNYYKEKWGFTCSKMHLWSSPTCITFHNSKYQDLRLKYMFFAGYPILGSPRVIDKSGPFDLNGGIFLIERKSGQSWTQGAGIAHNHGKIGIYRNGKVAYKYVFPRSAINNDDIDMMKIARETFISGTYFDSTFGEIYSGHLPARKL